jgi:F420-dependent oxidoreductase-like protein
MSIRFGVHVAPQFGYQYQTIEEIILQAEKIGYDLLTIGDHLFLDENSGDRDCLEAWSLLSTLVAKTNKIMLGTLVTCNSFRQPSILAKMASSIDVISNGRLLFCISASWKEVEYDAYGIPFPKVQERMDQLEETVQIIKLMWTQPKASFSGKHYIIKEAICQPKPVQKPHPPILVGGEGMKRTLKIVAKYADMCNFTFLLDKNPSVLLERLKEYCMEFGRDYDSIEKTFFIYCMISKSMDEIDEFLSRLAQSRGISIEQVKKERTESAGMWVGQPEFVLKKCISLIKQGFTLFQLRFPFGNESKMLKLFAEEVIPQIA